MSDKRLFWISKCPTCERWPGRFVEACATCAGRGEIREEVKTPMDDGEALTPEWVREVLPGSDPVGNTDNPCWGRHEGRLGRIAWQFYPRSGGLVVWVNGYNFEWRSSTRGDLRRLCEALGVVLKEGD